MLKYSPRNINSFIFISCSCLLLIAIFIEPFRSLNPCPMCMMQRAIFIFLGVTALIAALHNPSQIGQRIYAFLTTTIALGGLMVAGRQIWLQNLPEDRIPACGPGIDYMLEVFPLLDVIAMSLRGTGDCAEVQWSLFSITIPGWSFLAFLAVIIISLSILFTKKQNNIETP